MLHGDCRDVLPTLPANSVHCVVTSPPYYGLRDYGTAQWDGGDAGCDHLGPPMRTNNKPSDALATFHGGTMRANEWFRDICGKCGARRIDRQLGLEATPDEYIQTMVAVFREVRRVLRNDGVMFLNIGDSYCSTDKWGGGVGGNNGKHIVTDDGSVPSWAVRQRKQPIVGIKPKDLLMMPARLALALQADGWWIRSDIIWAKPNPMPESVTDRPTSAHEHVFLLTKSARYFYDADAVREEALQPVGEPADTPRHKGALDASGYSKQGKAWAYLGSNQGAATRNLRNVWTIATHAYPEAHFATFPPELAERCIKAGTSERGCCAQCGAPWVRQVERSVTYTSGSGRAGNVPEGKYQGSVQALSGDYDIRMGPSVSSVTTGWSPGCTCRCVDPASPTGPYATKPCTVLDPFAGAGTTMLVSDRLQRHAIGIELNEAYAMMARNRIVADAPLFAEVAD